MPTSAEKRREEERREAKRAETERREKEQLEAERKEATRLEKEHAAAESARGSEQQLVPEPKSETVETSPPTMPSPPPVQTQHRPQPQTAAASAATAPAPPEPEPETEHTQFPGRKRFGRKGTRPQEMEDELESPLVRRLKQAAAYSAELEALVEELPFIADLSSMADGLVSEVESQFRAQVASVFVRRTDGYHVIAHRGLSRVEAGMVVPETQPLFGDVLQTGEGILIQPVDLAQGLVAGIGGARTEAIMAVPAVVHGACVAIVIVGRDHFSEGDLDQLNDLAGEAAPGLAVALSLARLGERI